ncbi:Replication protein [Bordetella tumbae]|uniref:replication protein P n=1 Tax=Bordetella tumbae TaxID=1649139 RepID=UPI0039EF521D
MTTVAQSTSKQAGWSVPLAKLEGISLIDHLWNRLSGTYGGRWLKDFPDMQSIENWKGAWAEAFDEEGLTPHEVAEGLRACRRMYDWPPSVSEFIKACRPGLIPENAFHDAVAGMTARQRGEVGNWSHPAVYWAAVRVGRHDLLNCGYAVMQTRWERALSEELARSSWEPIPAPAKALPPPAVDERANAKAAEAIKEISNRAVAPDSARDPTRGARRVLAEQARKGGRRYSPAVVKLAQAAVDAMQSRGAQA